MNGANDWEMGRQPDDFNEREHGCAPGQCPADPVNFEAAKRHVAEVALADLAAEADKRFVPVTPAGHAPTEAKARKALPVCTGCLDYFPDALLAVAELSRIGNDQHNPGQPLHWAKDKSTDEPDALLRHLIDRGTRDTDGVRHSAKVAWRALALLQREIEAERPAAPAPKPDAFVVEAHLESPSPAYSIWYPSAIRCRTLEEATLHAEGLRRERGCAVRIRRNGAIELVAMPNEAPLCELGDDD